MCITEEVWLPNCKSALSGTEPVGIPIIVVMAFVRLTTHPAVAENPMSVKQAKACVEEWLDQPNCRALPMGEKNLALFFNLLSGTGQGGNLSTDAMIAATAKEYGGKVYSNDHDFDRFPDVKWTDPL